MTKIILNPTAPAAREIDLNVGGIVPDLWHVAHRAHRASEAESKMILETWHLAHDLLSFVRESYTPRFYFVFIWGDVEPETFGPFDTWEAMTEKAKDTRQKEGPDEGGYYWFEMIDGKAPTLETFTGSVFDEWEAPDPDDLGILDLEPEELAKL